VTLCPRFCRLGDGQAGFLLHRKTSAVNSIRFGYAHPPALLSNPIEKKALESFSARTGVLSFGTAGSISAVAFVRTGASSKAKLDEAHSLGTSPKKVVQLAIQRRFRALLTYKTIP